MKAAALVVGVLVLLVGAWKLIGPGADSLGPKLKENLNQHPLLHSHHTGVVESVECEEDVAVKLPNGESLYDCVVRYEDGFVEPWCAGLEGVPGGPTGTQGKRCADIKAPPELTSG